MFSPMDLLGATNIVQQDVAAIETKQVLVSSADLVKASSPTPTPDVNAAPSYMNQVRAMQAEGEATMLFSPVEAVQAGQESRRPHVAQESMATKAVPQPPVPTFESPTSPGFSQPVEESKDLSALANSEGEATVILTLPAGGISAEPLAPEESDPFAGKWDQPEKPLGDGNSEEEMGTMVFQPDFAALPAAEPSAAPGEFISSSAPVVSFVPIPQLNAAPPVQPELSAAAAVPDPASRPAFSAEPEAIDMGDDLLDGPTRGLLLPENDATAHLFKEIKQDIAEKKVESADNVEYMLKKAERYIAKRNYYLARKALRHSLALGADELKIKERLRDIRKLEMPDSLYNAVSSDDSSQEASGEILDRLEEEFELEAEENEHDEMTSSLENQLESIFRESDARTILDFGVGLHEMGMYRQAETVFSRLVSEFPESAFDAYYLAAVSKFSRKDYAGAASILKKLSGDTGKSELQKIQIYYALGELFEKMRRPERSKEFFKKVAELDSNYRNIRHKLEE